MERSANHGTAMLSNVPAPRRKVSICGVSVSDMSFFVLTPLCCYLGILSYAGKMNATFNLDDALDVDPQLLASAWNEEFEALYSEVEVEARHGVIKEPPLKTGFYRGLGWMAIAAFVLGVGRLAVKLRNYMI
jgi:hypothetical protein